MRYPGGTVETRLLRHVWLDGRRWLRVEDAGPVPPVGSRMRMVRGRVWRTVEAVAPASRVREIGVSLTAVERRDWRRLG